MKDLYVSWDEYNRLIEKLALKVWESAWSFDAILCLARGGLRVGDVMSRLFDRPLGVLFTSSYRENAGTTQSRLIISEHLSSAAPLPGGRWLLVDDLVDSGATLVEGWAWWYARECVERVNHLARGSVTERPVCMPWVDEGGEPK